MWIFLFTRNLSKSESHILVWNALCVYLKKTFKTNLLTVVFLFLKSYMSGSLLSLASHSQYWDQSPQLKYWKDGYTGKSKNQISVPLHGTRKHCVDCRHSVLKKMSVSFLLSSSTKKQIYIYICRLLGNIVHWRIQCTVWKRSWI